MVQRVTVSPSEVRGYGDIVSPKTTEDFTEYMCELSESDGVYTMAYDDTTSYLRLSVSPSSAEYGDTVEFTASLMIEGELVEGETISFYEGDTLIGTAETGLAGAAVLTKTDLSIATHNVYAVYDELESQTVTVTVSKISVDLSLSTDKSAVVGEESFTLSGVLSLGSGKTVKLYDNGTFVKNITTGTDGAFSETVSDASVGSHSYYMAYLGDETTKSVTSSPVTVTVTQITPTISLATDKSTVGTGDSFTLSGVLSVVGSGVDVKLYNGETLVDTLQTGTGGAFSKTITATVTGINTYHAVFEGTAEYSSVTSNNVEVTVKIMPTLTLSTSSASVTAGGSYTLSGALTYDGRGIQTNDLRLEVNGVVAAYLSTGRDGTFSKTYSNAVIGTYSYKVVHDETTTYAAVESSNVSVVVSNSQPASISLTGTKNILSYADSESSVLTATVLDDNDDPVEGATVELYKDNVLWDTLTTGSAGTVSKTYTSAGIGDVSFKAECGSLVSERYDIEDCLKTHMGEFINQYSSGSTVTETFNDVLQSTFKIEFDMLITQSTNNSCFMRIGETTTKALLIGKVGSTDSVWKIYARNGTDIISTGSSISIGNDWIPITLSFDGTTFKFNNDISITNFNGISLSKLVDVVSWKERTSSGAVRNIKIKPL